MDLPKSDRYPRTNSNNNSTPDTADGTYLHAVCSHANLCRSDRTRYRWWNCFFYVPPATNTTPIVYNTVAQPTTSLSPTAATFVPAGTSTTMQPSTTGFTIQDLALLLASTKKNHLPEWKLAQYNGDPIQWHEWFGQFKSAIDSAHSQTTSSYLTSRLL